VLPALLSVGVQSHAVSPIALRFSSCWSDFRPTCSVRRPRSPRTASWSLRLQATSGRDPGQRPSTRRPRRGCEDIRPGGRPLGNGRCAWCWGSSIREVREAQIARSMPPLLGATGPWPRRSGSDATRAPRTRDTARRPPRGRTDRAVRPGGSFPGRSWPRRSSEGPIPCWLSGVAGGQLPMANLLFGQMGGGAIRVGSCACDVLISFRKSDGSMVDTASVAKGCARRTPGAQPTWTPRSGVAFVMPLRVVSAAPLRQERMPRRRCDPAHRAVSLPARASHSV